MADRIRNSTGLDKAALAQDFKNNPALLKAMSDESELVEVWKEVKHLTSFRSEAKFLKSLKEIKNDDKLIKHLFKGNIEKDITNPASPIFKATGVHHQSALTNKTSGFTTGDVRLKLGASVTPYNGGYQTKIQIYHEDLYRIQLNDRNIPISEKGWKTKTKESTFFPDNWTQEQILEEIGLAHSNKSFVKHSPPNDLYHGQSSTGIWIEMPISPSGRIESAYFE